MGNVATGLLAGWNAARLLSGEPLLELPATTMLGALCRYITSAEEKHFQPMKANFGLLPPLENPPRAKLERGAALAARAVKQLRDYIADQEGALALPLTPASSV
jgi:methylenetetrahydrofolate--tRNA-(uracil-5-)-methyltransferase